MINKAMFRRVQAFKRQGYSKGAIVTALEFDPRTVAKYFAMEEEDYRAYRQDHLFRDKAFDELRSEIIEVYEANEFHPLDFGRFRCRSGLVLHIFTALLSASRYKYVIFQSQPFRTLDVIRHLLDSFDYFGGRPTELVIDQDRLMVVSENAGDIIYTKDFKHFIDEQELGLYVCRRADPETKGKIENLVKFVKGNFLATRDFATVEEANAGVLR